MLRLSRGPDEVIVTPETGGAIVSWTRDDRAVLRQPAPGAPAEPGAMGCFPLVPFCNRIGFRRFVWAGQPYELAPNFGDHPHAIHGVGWQRAWRVEEAAADRAVLSLRHEASASWPFPFDATLTYDLTGLGLSIGLRATNRHGAPAPMGVGLHPYFPRPSAGAAVRFDASGVWFNHPDALAERHGPIPAAWDHAGGRAVDDEPLDNCFTGWTGRAALPGLTIQADAAFRDLQVFTPAGADFFCVEPVSHAPDAINRGEMAVLAPGESLEGVVRFLP